MKIVIIEDEELTAQDLADTIYSINSNFKVVKTLNSVSEARLYFKKNIDFDLIFSDIELGDGLSFEIFKNIELNIPIIFCTAFNEYALQAFDVNGIDYILKPFDKNSIEKSLNKFTTLKGNKTSNTSDYNKLIDLLSAKNNTNHPQSLLTYQGDKIIPIKILDISLVYSENEKSYIICGNSKPTQVNHSLEELENLFGIQFFRANRQIIINKNCVKEVNHYFQRKLLIKPTINYADQILVSKAKAPEFLEWLKS